MNQVFLKPSAGRVLRDHTDRFRLIGEEGKTVVLDRVFKKRIADGDAEIVVVQKPRATVVMPKPVEISTGEKAKEQK